MKWFQNNILQDKIPLLLSIVLYLLIYLVRLQQGGWEVELDLFPQIRVEYDKKITSLLPSPQAELLSGIVLGEKKDLPYGLRLALRDTSTLHMVVVSGQNLSLLAALIIGLSGLITRRIAILTTLFVIGSYVIITGGQIPVLRAAVMAVIAYLAQVLGRPNDGLRALTAVAALFLLINPSWIGDLSFQLSFLATFGVVVVAPALASYLKKLPFLLKESLSMTIGAQLMVLPVISQNFHQISLVSIPANLLTLWTIPYIMGWGTVMLLLTTISDVFGRLIAYGLNLILTYFVFTVQFFASLPFAWEYIGEQVWIVWVGYYMILAASLLSLNNAQEKNSGRS